MAGLGVASTQILPPISKLPFIEITAAADTRADAVAKFREQYKAEGYASIDELCASPNVDAVYIATPNSLHAEHAITAAKHNKHIIVEKPMAMTLTECDAMNEKRRVGKASHDQYLELQRVHVPAADET